MKKLTILIIFVLTLKSWSQSAEQNWVKTTIYKSESTNPIAAPEPDSVQVNVTYLDGLGRPIQQIANMQSSDSKDIITHIEYDGFGRQVKQFLPFAGSNANMEFVADGASATASFAEYSGQLPYSQTAFENSPANRVLKQSAPGTTGNWAMESGHEIRYKYGTNGENDHVKRYTAASNAITDDGFYAKNTLYKTTVRDENDGITETFTNLKGQLVLKRAFNVGYIDTYYLYDPSDNLAYVVPPLATDPTDLEVLANLCYSYKYDQYNRLVEKNEPEKQTQYIIYDKLNRIVATGPAFDPFGHDETLQGWLLTRYDYLNRVAYTGWYKQKVDINVASALQESFNHEIYNVTKRSDIQLEQTHISYTIDGLPANFLLLTINYYDDYNFYAAPTSFTADASRPDSTVYYTNTIKPIGLPTGSWERILQPGTDEGKNSYILYDKWARPIVSATDDGAPGGYTTSTTTLNFSGQALATDVRHKLPAQVDDLRVLDSYEYSAQGRIEKHYNAISGHNTEILALNSYSKLGRLAIKETGYTGNGSALQHIDYSYNIRGWLTGINDYHDIVHPKDLFAFGISYDQVADVDNNKAQFNGNISETYWRSYNDNVLRKYNYAYDGLNRMYEAVYEKNNAVTDSYNETVSYDDNGNITYMNRNGNQDNMMPPVIGIDDLQYNYKPKSNRLEGVYDYTNSTLGFSEKPQAQPADVDYEYDANGNLVRDDNKMIKKIRYNHLNLPTEIIFDAEKNISYIYTASGEKIQKLVNDFPEGNANPSTVQTDYKNGFQYVDGILRYFPTSEGYVAVTQVHGKNKYNYVYNYLDHLGNIRLSYGLNEDGIIKILEENEYYPYGLKHSNYNRDVKIYQKAVAAEAVVLKAAPVVIGSDDNYDYKFNGQEWQDELGLNMTAMDFRQYDNAIGRFVSIDLLSENNYSQSPYQFANNNPSYFSDPTGLDDIIIDMNTVQSGTTINFLHTQFDVDNAVGDLYLRNEEGGLTYVENSLGMVTVQAGGAGWRTHANFTIQSHVYWRSQYYDSFRSRQFSSQIDDLQSMLDGVGTIDPSGIVDGVNALGYMARGQKANAAIAAIGIIPYLGDSAKAGKLFNKAERIIGKELKYQDRVLKASDKFHNFPVSFDKEIIKNGAWSQRLKDGADWYELKGTINNTDGIYQIGINASDEIFHKAFIPY